MKTDFYFDMKMEMAVRSESAPSAPVRRTKTMGDETCSGAMPAHVVWMSQAMSALHKASIDVQHPFAVAFPEYRKETFKKLGSVLRVFTSSREAADALAERLEQNAWVARDRAAFIGRTQMVPEDFTGPYVVHRRVDRPRRGKIAMPEFRKRLDALKALPSFPMSSASNGQAFFLAIDRRQEHEKPNQDATPDSYGLSRATNEVFLPDLSDRRRYVA